MEPVVYLCSLCGKQFSKDEMFEEGEVELLACKTCVREKMGVQLENEDLVPRKRGPKFFRTLGRVGEAFVTGVTTQLTDEGTVMIGAAAGLHQGLKYKGDIKRGAITTAAVIGCIAVGNGIVNIFRNTEYIKNA